MVLIIIIIFTCFFVSIYFHFKMIFLLEENGVRISKLSDPFTVLNKFSSLRNRQDLKMVTSKQARIYYILAKTGLYLTILLYIGFAISIIILW